MFIVGKSFFSETLSKFNRKTIPPLCFIHIPKNASRTAMILTFYYHVFRASHVGARMCGSTFEIWISVWCWNFLNYGLWQWCIFAITARLIHVANCHHLCPECEASWAEPVSNWLQCRIHRKVSCSLLLFCYIFCYFFVFSKICVALGCTCFNYDFGKHSVSKKSLIRH